jgi:hypothetical protein
MKTKTPSAVIGAVVAMSLAASAVMAQQAGAVMPRQEFKGPVKEVRECLANLDTDFPQLKGLKTELCGFVWFQGWNDMCQPGDKALENDAEYQKAKKESDRHVCNWYCHYQGSARVYCMVGYSLAEAMKPLLTTKP